MKQFKIDSVDGTITVQPHSNHVTFIYRTNRFQGIESLMAYLFPTGATNQASRRYEVTLRDKIKSELITAYQYAVRKLSKQPTTIDLINELCSRGVKVSDLTIQCQQEDCKEECGTSNSVLVELGEAAVEAAEIEGFCDKRLICIAHKAEEDEIHHQEELAEEIEARRTECCDH